MKYCEEIQNKGYKIFIHPMHTGSYTDIELIDLLEQINKVNPFGFTIVDTTGSMTKNDINRLFKIIDSKLNLNIALAFHSHNNLNLSFENSIKLIQLCTNRDLIIDSTLYGIGRGAGNLKTELIVKHLNNEYNLFELKKVINELILPIYKKNPWGYSKIYELSAKKFCHPNYATFLINKNFPDEFVNTVLNSIPLKKRLSYDEKIIKQLIIN